MHTALVLGYSAFDLGLFNEKDIRLKIIKKAIRRDLERLAEEGLQWLVFTGSLGFEHWVLEVAKEMKDDYGFQLATIFDFEAKDTRQKNAFPMKNFHSHQIQHMEQVLEQQGICFVLIHFSSYQETYLLPAIDLIRFYQKDMGKKSMPLDYIREHGYVIEQQAFPQIPYLDIVKLHLLGGKTI